MTGYVIQATEKLEFEDGLRTRVQLELLCSQECLKNFVGQRSGTFEVALDAGIV